MEKRLLFPGCLVFARFQEYELAAKAVLKRLGIELVDMDGFSCCSSSIVPPFSSDWINLPAYNLALAESRRLDIVTLCGSCTRSLRLTQQQLAGDAVQLEEVNRRLAEVGLEYHGSAGVSHIIEILAGRLDKIAAGATRPPGYRVALSHPCNVIRPSAALRFDDPWKPRKMRDIVEAAGATLVDYDLEFECCGATLMMVDEEWATRAARAKLHSALDAGADLMVVSCGNCFLSLGRMQDRLGPDEPELPVMFLPQLVGLALGIGKEALGLS